MHKTSLRCVALLLFVCILLAGGMMVIPKANGLDVPMHYIYSLAEYEAELAKYELPGDYVTYDMVKTVGNFVMMCLGVNKTLTADHINFILRDKTGVKVSLSAPYPNEYNGLVKDWVVTDRVTDIHDLRQTQSIGEENWYYKNGEIFYNYKEGDLIAIRWSYRERIYGVSLYGVDYEFRNYPMTEDTFVARLLDVDTAQAAVDELMASVDAGQKELKWQEFWRELREWSIAIVGAAVIVGGGIAIWKLRERKRLLDEIEEEEFKAAHKEE